MLGKSHARSVLGSCTSVPMPPTPTPIPIPMLPILMSPIPIPMLPLPICPPPPSTPPHVPNPHPHLPSRVCARIAVQSYVRIARVSDLDNACACAARNVVETKVAAYGDGEVQSHPRKESAAETLEVAVSSMEPLISAALAGRTEVENYSSLRDSRW